VTTYINTVAITNGNRANKSSGIPHHRNINIGRTARATFVLRYETYRQKL
jgi:hypothetical protein